MSVNGTASLRNGPVHRAAQWWARSRLRERLMLLVILAVFPAFALIVYSAIEQRRMGTKAALHEAMHLARNGAAVHDRMLSGAQQLLITLSQLNEVRTLQASACATVFSNALLAQPIYANIGLLDANGNIVVSHVPTANRNRSDRPYFWATTNHLDFTIGAYKISERLGKPIVSLGYPVHNFSNELVGVVYAALDLSWFKGIVTNLNLPPQSSVTVLSGSRITLVRHPDPEQRFTGLPLEKFYSNVKTNTFTRIPQEGAMLPGPRLSRDGVWRLYAAAPLRRGTAPLPDSTAVIGVGIPLSAAYADTNRALASNVLLLLAVGALTSFVAWHGAELFVLRRVRALVQTAQALKAGNLDARTGARHYRGELGELAGTFDAMAESLQQRVEEREHAETAVRHANRKLEALNSELERRVQIRTEELHRTNQELQAFAHLVADDLQEPIGTITSRMGMLKESCAGRLDGAASEYVEFAADGATRMGGLIEGLLAYARLDSQPPPREPLPVDEIVDCALQNLTLAIQESQARVQRGPLPAVMGDHGQLIQLFQNLIGNALKFRKPGQPAEVVIAAKPAAANPDSARRAETFVEFSVSDNGIGIAPQYFQRIFLIFQRLHLRNQYPGTGIGLSICKKIVERHGGRIWVESAPGEGATFRFTLLASADLSSANQL